MDTDGAFRMHRITQVRVFPHHHPRCYLRQHYLCYWATYEMIKRLAEEISQALRTSPLFAIQALIDYAVVPMVDPDPDARKRKSEPCSAFRLGSWALEDVCDDAIPDTECT
jgi:hypothetical protein